MRQNPGLVEPPDALSCAPEFVEAAMGRIDETRPFLTVNIAVLTVSDTRTMETDTSGATLAERIVKAGHTVAVRKIEKDDAGLIEILLRRWIADPTIDAVSITTGGTGITSRDVTPEAFDRVLEKEDRRFWRIVPDVEVARRSARQRSSPARWVAWPAGHTCSLYQAAPAR